MSPCGRRRKPAVSLRRSLAAVAGLTAQQRPTVRTRKTLHRLGTPGTLVRAARLLAAREAEAAVRDQRESPRIVSRFTRQLKRMSDTALGTDGRVSPPRIG